MKKQYLEAGQIVSTHGLQGEFKILPWADEPEFLLDFKTVYLDGNAMRVVSSRVQKTCVLMKLEGVSDVESAAKLRGKTVFISRDEAKLEEGAMFIADLIGLDVICDGRTIGKVQDILQRPANNVYVVKGEHEYMIPAVPEYILERNTDEGIVRVRLIEGMCTDEI
ncbi:MAG: 16S rRNA processing protein RimM [Oscillospiraceae bacterium]|nr:16S rRNA processing protein RimM [Oscillospiraceae bacterium]